MSMKDVLFHQRTRDAYWIEDPGHAWLAIRVQAFPWSTDYGTGFGYRSPGWIYLEEDLEAPRFLEAHPELDGPSLPVVLFRDYESPVRRFRRNEDRLEVGA